jgi:cyclase
LDVDQGKVVKGKNFVNLVNMGDPLQLLRKYCEDDADEIMILDISASLDGRKNLVSQISAFSKIKDRPLTVGGGIKCLDDAKALFDSGADRVSLNSILFENIELCSQIANIFGSQAVIAALDYFRLPTGTWICKKLSGKIRTEVEMLEMAKRCERAGAGELLLTSIDRDGTKQGYDTESVQAVTGRVKIPVIASGGAGQIEDLAQAYKSGATGFLVASKLHSQEWTINQVRLDLKKLGVSVRSLR